MKAPKHSLLERPDSGGAACRGALVGTWLPSVHFAPVSKLTGTHSWPWMGSVSGLSSVPNMRDNTFAFPQEMIYIEDL